MATASEVDEMRPGDRLVITPMAVRNGVYRSDGRTRSIYGELVRVVHSYREPGVRRLKVLRDGNKCPDTYAIIFWRKLLPGETVDVAALIEEGERMRERDGMPRMNLPSPAPAPTRAAATPSTEADKRKPHPAEKVWPWSPNYAAPAQAAEVSPETMVWALAPDGGRHYGITRRMCRLRDVPTGWAWEPREDD